MSTITQVISTSEAYPNRNTSPETFADDGDLMMTYMEGMPTEFNTFANQTNVVAGEVNANATAAELAESNATNQVSLAADQAALATTNGEAQVSLAADQAALATTGAVTSSSNADIVATQSAFIASLYALVGLGIDSDGFLFVNINAESNISSMALNADGELITTYA